MRFRVYREAKFFRIRKVTVSLYPDGANPDFYGPIDMRRIFGPFLGLKNFEKRLAREKAKMWALAKVTQD